MRVLKLTRTVGETALFNWDNVTFVADGQDHFGNKFTEVHLTGGKVVTVKEDVSSIEDSIPAK